MQIVDLAFTICVVVLSLVSGIVIGLLLYRICRQVWAFCVTFVHPYFRKE